MAYTGEKIFMMAMAKMDEMTETGSLNPEDVAEYRAKAPYLLEIWSKRMAKRAGQKKIFEMSCVRKKNLLGDLSHISEIVENNNEEQKYSAKGANCFYIGVDGDCTVSFTENGTPLSGKYVFNDGDETDFTGDISITVPEGTTSFLSLKGILLPQSQDSQITMTVSGQYYFRHINRSLSPYKYPSASKVPDFKAYYKVEMPSDFISRSQIITEYPKWQYQEGNSQIKWEGDNLYTMFSYDGLIRIVYISQPTKIASLEQEIEYPEHIAISAVPYLVKCFARSDMMDELSADAREEFMQMYVDAVTGEPLTPTEIADVFDWGVGD